MIVENPHRTGVYVSGHGVVAPGDTLTVKKNDEAVQAHLSVGSLRERGADEPDRQTSEPELPNEPVPEDPAPAVIETDTGVPPTDPADAESESDTTEEATNGA